MLANTGGLTEDRPVAVGRASCLTAIAGRRCGREGERMTAFNVVRYRVRPDREQEFVNLHAKAKHRFTGFRKGSLIHTGERTYCFLGEWNDMSDIVAARSQMIAFLDTFRHTLEDLGGGLGVTDPVSGKVVVEV
jgi:hypothetical protein